MTPAVSGSYWVAFSYPSPPFLRQRVEHAKRNKCFPGKGLRQIVGVWKSHFANKIRPKKEGSI